MIVATSFGARRVIHYWHLLSLDAPSVAVLWTWFIARCVHLEVGAELLAAMFVAVWILYTSDRIFDVLFCEFSESDELQERHIFHWQHRRVFMFSICFASIVLLFLVFQIPWQILHQYFALASAVMAYFMAIRMWPNRIPKELIVAIVFSVTAFIPALVLRQEYSLSLVFSALSFGLVCWLIGLFISSWEQRPQSFRIPVSIAIFALFGLIFLAPSFPITRQINFAVELSLVSLLLLHFLRQHFQATTLRTLSDATLLAPLLAILATAS